MTPIEFWDYYCGFVDKTSGGKPDNKMTLDKSRDLQRDIQRRLKKKGISWQ